MERGKLDVKLGKLPIHMVMFGYILLLGGLLALQTNMLLAVAVLVGGIFLVTAQDRLLFDFENKSVYKYSILLFMKRGTHIDLSQVQYISMVRVNVSQRMYNVSVARTTNDTMIWCNLIMPKNKRIDLFKKKYSESKELCTAIANGLGIRLLDVSTGEKVWIEPTVEPIKNKLVE